MDGAKGWTHHVFSKITQPWLVSWKACWGSELSSGTFCRQPPGRGSPGLQQQESTPSWDAAAMLTSALTGLAPRASRRLRTKD